MKLKTLIGNYPVTKQFRTHTDRFAFAEFQGSVATMFKRVVRNLEFDVAEMAIMTYLWPGPMASRTACCRSW